MESRLHGSSDCAEAICYNNTYINDPCVDGLSVTYTSNNTREHIWTLMTDSQYTGSCCPCRSDLVHYRTSSFDYYCELLNNLDNNSPLWDGEGCSDVFANDAPCCENPNLS